MVLRLLADYSGKKKTHPLDLYLILYIKIHSREHGLYLGTESLEPACMDSNSGSVTY